MVPPAAIEIEAIEDTEAITLPDPLTIDAVSARRAKAGKLVAGTASSASSDVFKGVVSIISLSEIRSDDFRPAESPKRKDGIVR